MGKAMKSTIAFHSACGLIAASAAFAATTETAAASMTEKLQPYIECYNDISGRAHDSQARYLSWVNEKAGPTGKEKIVYGLYTISGEADCAKGVEAAAKMEPHDAALESAGASYAAAVTELAPLLKEANDYYDQKDYQDDKMAKGKAMHQKLMAAWSKFAAADKKLDDVVSALNDKAQLEELAAIEKSEGKKWRYYVLSAMAKAKALMRAEGNASAAEPPKITDALAAYEAAVKDLEQYPSSNKDKIGSSFISSTKNFLASAKGLMRRIRDKTPFSTGEKMLMQSQGGAWMVEGSLARVNRDYNQLVEAFNRGAKF